MRENSFIKEKSAKYLYEDYYRKYINQIVEILEDISSRGGKMGIWFERNSLFKFFKGGV